MARKVSPTWVSSIIVHGNDSVTLLLERSTLIHQVVGKASRKLHLPKKGNYVLYRNGIQLHQYDSIMVAQVLENDTLQLIEIHDFERSESDLLAKITYRNGRSRFILDIPVRLDTTVAMIAKKVAKELSSDNDRVTLYICDKKEVRYPRNATVYDIFRCSFQSIDNVLWMRATLAVPTRASFKEKQILPSIDVFTKNLECFCHFVDCVEYKKLHEGELSRSCAAKFLKKSIDNFYIC